MMNATTPSQPAGAGQQAAGDPAAGGPSADAGSTIRRGVWLLVLLVLLVIGNRWAGAWVSSLLSPRSETLSDYLRTLPGDGAQQSCRAGRCSINTVSGKPAGASAVRLVAQLLPVPARRLELPASFNRAYLLSEYSDREFHGWGAVGPDATVTLASHEWKVQYTWWAGGQRFDSLRLPEPGYIRALAPRDGSAPVPIGHFSADGLGFRLRDYPADSPAPYDFSEAVFQPVPASLRLRVERQDLAGLVPGDAVTLADDLLERSEPRGRRIDATVVAMSAVDGQSGRMELLLDLNGPSRQIWQQLCVQREARHRSLTMPATIQLAAARTGGARDGQFVWLPSSAVQPRARVGGAAAAARHQVWVIFGEFAAPVAVVLGARDGGNVAVLEVASPGLEAAIDHEAWADLSPPQRREVLRQLGGNGRNLHLYPGMPVIVDPGSDLKPGLPVRSAQRS